MNREERKKALAHEKKMSGEHLKEFRDDTGLSQQKLADILGIPRQYVQRYEKGIVKLPDDYAGDIVKHFPSYRKEWLMGKSDIKTQDGLALEQLISKTKKKADTKIEFVKLITNERGYEFVLYSSGLLGPHGKPVDTFIVRKGKKQAKIILDDLIDDISDYMDFKLTRILQNGGRDNGKH